jgi:hypothetical protein
MEIKEEDYDKLVREFIKVLNKLYINPKPKPPNPENAKNPD